jgi:folate-binding protein YgfZ
VFRVVGRDAVDLLGRLSTNDLAPLARGRSVTTLFLSPTGRMLHVVLLQPDPDGASLRAVVEVAPGESSSFPEWIERYTFAEDARIEPAADLCALEIAGEGALRPSLSEVGAHECDGNLAWSRRDLGSLPAAIVSGPRGEIEALARRIAPDGQLDGEARLQMRVLAGIPACGAEITDAYFPLEVGLVGLISFTKGCYTGQEVVARQDAYDKVTRRLVRLSFAQAPAPGDPLASEDKEGCRITSVAPRPIPRGDQSSFLALGYVRSRHAAPGTQVTTAAGLVGHVVSLASV